MLYDHIKTVVDALEPRYRSVIDVIRSVEWSRSYKWEVEFDPPPLPPFNQIFPAENISVPLANVRTDMVTGSIRTYEVPDGADSEAINISFYDDERFTLANYFLGWMEDITQHGDFILSLDASCRIIHYRKLNSRDQVIFSRAYQVFPRGELIYSGNVTSEVTTFSLDFVIAGEI